MIQISLLFSGCRKDPRAKKEKKINDFITVHSIARSFESHSTIKVSCLQATHRGLAGDALIQPDSRRMLSRRRFIPPPGLAGDALISQSHRMDQVIRGLGGVEKGGSGPDWKGHAVEKGRRPKPPPKKTPHCAKKPPQTDPTKIPFQIKK